MQKRKKKKSNTDKLLSWSQDQPFPWYTSAGRHLITPIHKKSNLKNNLKTNEKK